MWEMCCGDSSREVQKLNTVVRVSTQAAVFLHCFSCYFFHLNCWDTYYLWEEYTDLHWRRRRRVWSSRFFGMITALAPFDHSTGPPRDKRKGIQDWKWTKWAGQATDNQRVLASTMTSQIKLLHSGRTRGGVLCVDMLGAQMQSKLMDISQRSNF